MKKIFLFLLLVSFLDAKVVYLSTPQEAQKTTQKIIIGAVENIAIMDANITKKARIDTGARITSTRHKYQKDRQGWRVICNF